MPRYSTVTRKITTPLAAAANDPVGVVASLITIALKTLLPGLL